MVTVRPQGARTIEEILDCARARLVRLTPREALGELVAGGVLIDIRPAAQRAAQGEIPGSTIVERNHLEWRLDPFSDARLPWVTGYDHRIIVFCVDGYTSSLAAAALLDLGLHRATDVIGVGRVLRRGRSLTNCEAEILDARGTLVAKALATYKVG